MLNARNNGQPPQAYCPGSPGAAAGHQSSPLSTFHQRIPGEEKGEGIPYAALPFGLCFLWTSIRVELESYLSKLLNGMGTPQLAFGNMQLLVVLSSAIDI